MAAPKPAQAEVNDLQELLLQHQQLQETVLVLRDTLEQHKADADAREAALRASHGAEKRQLQDAIHALRGQLEQQQADSQDALQHCRAQAAAELCQLQQALIQQRQLLDQQHQGAAPS